jgi:hypothetical protein
MRVNSWRSGAKEGHALPDTLGFVEFTTAELAMPAVTGVKASRNFEIW